MSRKPCKPASRRTTAGGRFPKFRKLDAFLASSVSPMPAIANKLRVDAARVALTQLATGESNVLAWSVCCMVGNVMETMLERGIAADPDGLLNDAFLALRRQAQAFEQTGVMPPMSRGDHALVAGLVEDWIEIMSTAPARSVIMCYLQTDKRIEEIEAGKARPTDWTIETVDDRPVARAA